MVKFNRQISVEAADRSGHIGGCGNGLVPQHHSAGKYLLFKCIEEKVKTIDIDNVQMGKASSLSPNIVEPKLIHTIVLKVQKNVSVGFIIAVKQSLQAAYKAGGILFKKVFHTSKSIVMYAVKRAAFKTLCVQLKGHIR